MSFARAIATVGGLTMLSRVAGFVRDMLTAWVLGAGAAADIFFVAQRIPNWFRAMFAEGAFTVSFVPLYSATLERDGRDAADRFADQALSMMVAVLLPLTVLMLLAMPLLMLLVASGYAADSGTFARLVELGRITFPYLILISVVALQTGVLNALGRFGPGAAAPIMLNLCMIAAIVLSVQVGIEPNTALAWGFTVSGAVQLVWLSVSCRRAGVTLRLTLPRLSPDVRRLFRQMAPGALAASVIQINLVIGTHIASLLPAGAISYLYYADRLNQLPLGVIGIAIGTALLPTLARHVQAGDADRVRHYMSRGLEFGLLLGLPAAVALAAIPEPILTALFQRGSFGPADTAATALALQAYAIGIPAYVVSKVFNAAFFSRQDTRTPVKAAVVTLATNTGLALALSPVLGHVGIALASGVAAFLNVGLLGWGLHRRGHLALDAQVRRRAPRIALAAALMGLVLLGLELALHDLFTAGAATRVAALAGLIAAGGVSYAAFVLAFGGFRLADARTLLRR
ncbi:murein biosynthesis integral membrane protein MurJ [Rhodospirillum centenum]|uniref:Probable lipid II flippase MurJ n=1 Tax=Rhodospirillum centenum (strain ATCC 51521 / SW) TaxID=414684 RepID=B6IUS3_RHOCS|nr:murein biosynthesis integral membrane protein MurJ [Rhodospirillum centenum]ACJ00005.1 integral membrane protein MviN [Rhodospirillum centenum SW]